MRRGGSRIRRFVVLVATFALVSIIIWGVLKRDFVYDYYRMISYQPTAEMKKIRDSLDLTEHGAFIFNAAQPELADAKGFNKMCGTNDEVAVLGCYASSKIFVYNIKEGSLNGIRELATAHELLHAVWERTSFNEQKELASVLMQVYEKNKDVLEEEIVIYDPSERNEEIFVRVGTEIKELPGILENKYAEIFNNQDKIVDFYDSYIAVFNELEDRIEVLIGEMNDLNAEIASRKVEYENSVKLLNDSITEFNTCAMTTGCFKDESEFNVSRNQLLNEQDRLDKIKVEVDNLVEEYNLKVEEYNSSVIETEKLQNLMNANSKIEEIK